MVAHSVGRPGASLRPLGAISPLSSSASSVCLRERGAADFLDLGARDRLVVGDDGQRLHRHARQPARHLHDPAQPRREVRRRCGTASRRRHRPVPPRARHSARAMPPPPPRVRAVGQQLGQRARRSPARRRRTPAPRRAAPLVRDRRRAASARRQPASGARDRHRGRIGSAHRLAAAAHQDRRRTLLPGAAAACRRAPAPAPPPACSPSPPRRSSGVPSSSGRNCSSDVQSGTLPTQARPAGRARPGWSTVITATGRYVPRAGGAAHRRADRRASARAGRSPGG